VEVSGVLFFLSAFGLGIAFFATPGAVTAQLLRRGLQRGFLSALSLQLGALVGVVLWSVIALIGAAMLVQNALVRLILGVVGVLLLLQLMWLALRDAYRGKALEAKSSNVRGDFALGAALSLANPLPIAFWLSIGSTVISAGKASLDPQNLLVFFVGFLSSALLWCFFMAGLIAWGQRFVSPLFFRLVNLTCGLALGFFALKLLWNTLMLLKG
jgi:threonine/homoserine/homoserine lactone efflux protein